MGKSSDNVLVRISSWFFKNWRLTFLLWVLSIGSGAIIYTSVIQREGFPTIQFPLSIVQGTYFVDDVVRVDKELAQPVDTLFSNVEGVKKVSITSGGNFFTAVVNFEDGVNAAEGTDSLRQALDDSGDVPTQANLDFIVIDPAAFLNEFDMLLSVYSVGESSTTEDLEEVADYVVAQLGGESLITDASKQSLIETALNPLSGKEETRQTKFNQIGLKKGNDLDFFKSITIGVDRDREKIDVIELSELIKDKLATLDISQFDTKNTSYSVIIGADFAESIGTQVSSLQSNLLTGLLAVALVSFLMISWRASMITALFMLTVMATTVAILYFIGYTLNQITLFALVLSLGLFVDDATIVVEAIDANRKKKKKPRQIVHEAISKIGAASFAGTFTTVLVFLPMAFLSGLLGDFIRLMPITIIIALVTSLVLSLTIIPLLAKFFLFRTDKVSWFTRVNPLGKLETWTAKAVGELPRMLKTAPKLGRVVAASMFSLSIIFFMVSGIFVNKLSLNIFPPTKDSDQIGFQIRYPENYTLQQAESVAEQLNVIVDQEVGEHVTRVLYGRATSPNARSADALIELVPFTQRDTKSPILMEKLQNAIDDQIDSSVSVTVLQFDAGPPVDEFPFQVQIIEEDLARATALAVEIQEYIEGATITRSNGTTANVTETLAPFKQTIYRVDGDRTLTVKAAFNDDDVSALLIASEDYVKDKFTPEYLEERGYSEDSLGFDFGQETENAESFASLVWAFPLALLLMYVLLVVQFRSFLQPLLIFVAIPFTFLGVFSGLYFTDNALSFFVQVGMIGLIGIAVNNTILLTDYANQERKAGLGAIDAISNAATKRFRPLVTTTVTTVVALLPLALSDPFWEALAFTIIFGLVSSTILVVLSFPYYYLATEWIRMRLSKGTRYARKKATATTKRKK